MSFADAGDRILRGAAKGLYKAGTVIMAESQELVPVDTGTLKRSGRVEEPTIEGDSLVVTVGYGYGTEYEERAGIEEPTGPGYGLYVHERLDLQHNPPTAAKFLEIPARAMEAEIDAIVQESIRAED